MLTVILNALLSIAIAVIGTIAVFSVLVLLMAGPSQPKRGVAPIKREDDRLSRLTNAIERDAEAAQSDGGARLDGTVWLQRFVRFAAEVSLDGPRSGILADILLDTVTDHINRTGLGCTKREDDSECDSEVPPTVPVGHWRNGAAAESHPSESSSAVERDAPLDGLLSKVIIEQLNPFVPDEAFSFDDAHAEGAAREARNASLMWSTPRIDGDIKSEFVKIDRGSATKSDDDTMLELECTLLWDAPVHIEAEADINVLAPLIARANRPAPAVPAHVPSSSTSDRDRSSPTPQSRTRPASDAGGSRVSSSVSARVNALRLRAQSELALSGGRSVDTPFSHQSGRSAAHPPTKRLPIPRNVLSLRTQLTVTRVAASCDVRVLVGSRTIEVGGRRPSVRLEFGAQFGGVRGMIDASPKVSQIVHLALRRELDKLTDTALVTAISVGPSTAQSPQLLIQRTSGRPTATRCVSRANSSPLVDDSRPDEVSHLPETPSQWSLRNRVA